MALINVYKGIGNEHTVQQARGKLADNLRGYDLEHSIILRGGQRITADYELKDDDIIFIRPLPKAASTIAIIAVAVVAVGAGVAAGVAIYKSKEAQKQAEEAAKKAKEAAQSTSQLPYVKGAQNQAATGSTFPFIIGETLFTPYRLCPPHMSIAGARGEEQYYNVVLEVGFNNLLIKQLNLKNTTIKTFSETTPQNGAYGFDAGTYYDAENKIEIRQTGNFQTLTDCNEKVIWTEVGDEIKHDHASDDATENGKIEEEWREGVVTDLSDHAMKCEVIVLFEACRKYDNDSGGWKSQTVTLSPQWTNVNNPTESDWVDFTTGFNQNGTHSNTFTYTTKKQMRYAATQTFTAAQSYGKTIKVRLRRLTPKAEDNDQSTVALLGVNTYCYDARKSSSSQLVAAMPLETTERDKCCRIGIRVHATTNTDGMLDSFNVICEGTARTWNGTAWSTAKTPTRNLAAWVLEILTSDHHAPSKYDDSELDLDTFGAFYEYCEEQGFYADGAITKTSKKRTTLDKLLGNANAALVLSEFTGLMEVAIDNGRDTSVALLNSDNIISIMTTRDYVRQTDGKKIKYVNRDADYDVDSVTFMKDGGEYDPATDTISETSTEFITSYAHAYKYVWRQMAEETAQPRTATVKVSAEGAYYPLYSRVELQHRSLKIGLGFARIKAVTWSGGVLQSITLDGAVTFPDDTACGVIVQCVSSSGHGIKAIKVNGTGTTDTLEVITTVRYSEAVKPSAGDSLSFGELDTNGEFTTVTRAMKITNVEPADNGYTLTLKDYNSALYEYGTLPEYKSNLTRTPNEGGGYHKEYAEKGEAGAEASDAVNELAELVTNGVSFHKIHKINAVNRSGLSNVANLDELTRRLDEVLQEGAIGISITKDELTIQIENEDKTLRTTIQQTADDIILQAENMRDELQATLDVQAGAIGAMVQGGGATGSLSLSLELPAMIDADTRAAMVTASSEAKVNAVYAQVTGTDYYSILGNASDSVCKTLWTDLRTAGLLASQIEMNADQIVIDGGTAADITAQTIFLNGKVQADYIEVDTLAARIMEVSNLTVKSTLTLGDGTTNGILKSNNYTSGSAGFMIDGNTGNAEFNDANINGFLRSNNTPFQPIAMLNLGYNHNTIQLYNNKNVASVSRDATGVYTVTLSKPVRLKTHTYGDYQYIDVFALGNAHDTFDNGFQNVIIPTINWVRNYVNGRLTVVDGYATVSYFVLYFDDNNTDCYQDPRSAQIFIFGTETD